MMRKSLIMASVLSARFPKRLGIFSYQGWRQSIFMLATSQHLRIRSPDRRDEGVYGQVMRVRERAVKAWGLRTRNQGYVCTYTQGTSVSQGLFASVRGR